MKIIKIKKLKNNFYELTISSDEQNEIIKLSEDYLIKYQLYSNKEITEKEYLEIQTLANKSKIYHKTLNYLSYKMRTIGEVKTYLEKYHCSEELINEIIEKLIKLNYLNDKVYSDLYVKQQFDINKKGPLLIKKNLLSKKIAEDIINVSLEYINDEKINNNLIYLIEYYEKINKKKSIKQLKETILRNLLNKGYDYEVIIYQLNQYHFKNCKDESTLLKQEMEKAYKKYQKKYTDYDLKIRIINALLRKGFMYEEIINMYNSLYLGV